MSTPTESDACIDNDCKRTDEHYHTRSGLVLPSPTEFDKELEIAVMNYKLDLASNADTTFKEAIKQAVDKYVIGDTPVPHFNGKEMKRGKTVQIDLEKLPEASLLFVQENARYTMGAKQRKSLWGDK